MYRLVRLDGSNPRKSSDVSPEQLANAYYISRTFARFPMPVTEVTFVSEYSQ